MNCQQDDVVTCLRIGKHITVSMSECTQMIRANPAALFEQGQRAVVSTIHCWLFRLLLLLLFLILLSHYGRLNEVPPIVSGILILGDL